MSKNKTDQGNAPKDTCSITALFTSIIEVGSFPNIAHGTTVINFTHCTP